MFNEGQKVAVIIALIGVLMIYSVIKIVENI